MQNKLPDTSIDAFKALTPERLRNDYKCIIECLNRLKLANYEQISNNLGWSDINKCSRRLKELESMQIIFKPGSKSLTKRTRQAYNYALVGFGQEKIEPEKVMQGETVADISRKLVQKTLFEERDFYLEEEDW